MPIRKVAFMAGVPELLLKLLSEREMYGYELARRYELSAPMCFPCGRVCSTQCFTGWKPVEV